MAIPTPDSPIDIPVDIPAVVNGRPAPDWRPLRWLAVAVAPLQLSPWQRKVAGLCQSVDTLNTLLLAGGRGGGKSVLLVWLICFYALVSGQSFRGVLIRADLAGLQKLEGMLLDQIPMLLPGSKYLRAKRQWNLSNGGNLKLIHMDGNDGFNKIQGEDLSHVFWDELGQQSDPQVVLRVRSSMRTTDPSVVPKFIATANPLGPGSWWIRDYVVTKALPGRIFKCEFFGGSETAWVKSTLRDNPYLSNPDQYEAELKASCFGDESKISAEVYGDWGQVTAGFFGSALSIERNMLPGDTRIPLQGQIGRAMTLADRNEHLWLGCDWGTASPACAILMCQIVDGCEVGGKWMPRGSWLAVDEEYICSTQRDGSREWNRGDRTLTAGVFVDRVRRLLQRHELWLGSIPAKRTIMDSAVTAQLGFGGYGDPVTLSSEFKRHGWEVTGSPKSSRAVGWQLMKSLLYQAGRENEPGLFISERCQSLWQTLPYCVADDKNPEDMQMGAPDHSADSVRYVLTAANQGRHTFRGKAMPLMELIR